MTRNSSSRKRHYPRVPRNCSEDAYSRYCRACSAPPGHFCISWRTGRRSLFPHRSRRQAPRKIALHTLRVPLPDLSTWWRAMRIYEGQHPRPRPAGLTV